MVLKGQLNLKHDNDDYLIFSKGRLENVSEYLNLLLCDDVYVCVKTMYDSMVLFKAEGKLIKDKVSPKFYTYHICGQDGKYDLDSVLWNNVGNKLEIEIKNISKK